MSNPPRHGHASHPSLSSAVSLSYMAVDVTETEPLSSRKLGHARLRSGSIYAHHPSSSVSSASSLSSLSSHSFARPHKTAISRRFIRAAKAISSAPLRCIHAIHPDIWSVSAHLTDQASIALICYKLYILSITIPPWSKLYFYYLPSCMLSDVVAIAILQLGWWTAFGSFRRKYAGRSRGKSTSSGREAVRDSAEDESWLGKLKDWVKLPRATSPAFHQYTSLPLSTPCNSDSPETGLWQQADKRSAVQDSEDKAEHCAQLREQNVTEMKASSTSNRWTIYSILQELAWTFVKILHLMACLVAIVFTVIAIGAYSAGRVVFSWQGAFDSASQSGYLFGYAMTEFPHFFYTYLTILTGGTFVTLSRYWIALWRNEGLTADVIRQYTGKISGKLRVALLSLLLACFLAVCAAIRPPNALPATDLLIDGITATSALLLFSDDHTHPIALNKNTTIYGQSNIFQPRLTPINSDKIEHVFFLFMESADHLAWPYQPDQFCKHRNCEDMPEQYNRVEEFTPFFNDLIKNDPNAVFIKDFRTNLAYTIKSQLSSLCGVMPHVRDQVASEAVMNSATGCLPHIVKELGKIDTKNTEGKWKTGWFQAQITKYDSQDVVIKKEGFDDVWDVTNMTAKTGKKDYTNFFGYSDEELHPFAWDWVDERLKNKERIFLTIPGATMHHPFNMPPFAKTFKYTKQDWVNKYLNVVKRTDADLKRFFENLRKRNLLDKSLIVLQGDHGPRIGEDGIHTSVGWYEHIYRSPLLIRAPGLISHQIEQDPLRPFLSIDVLPTVLDALGVSPSLIKSFVGQSMLRARSQRHERDSYHSQTKGAQFPHHLRFSAKNRYKAVRMVTTGDTCALDLNVDPTETFFYCTMEGWRKVFEGDELKDGLMKEMYTAGSQEESDLISYARDARVLIDTHLQINADFWNVQHNKDQNEILMKGFLKTVREQNHWH
ncbi:alkaline phosphatase-like protein [Cystobasidium minutum MCA 4210]|uniref:alkaline phosphatase-like protein n=1 Tax=Cystobasidium minutum MCA 4210 TaxID=1397322 RepID=UPI0034CEE20C|eukprot:jgi/Rhomi1/14194/CE14193_3770